jgi:hypothetical protein
VAPLPCCSHCRLEVVRYVELVAVVRAFRDHLKRFCNNQLTRKNYTRWNEYWVNYYRKQYILLSSSAWIYPYKLIPFLPIMSGNITSSSIQQSLESSYF